MILLWGKSRKNPLNILMQIIHTKMTRRLFATGTVDLPSLKKNVYENNNYCFSDVF